MHSFRNLPVGWWNVYVLIGDFKKINSVSFPWFDAKKILYKKNPCKKGKHTVIKFTANLRFFHKTFFSPFFVAIQEGKLVQILQTIFKNIYLCLLIIYTEGHLIGIYSVYYHACFLLSWWMICLLQRLAISNDLVAGHIWNTKV